MTSEDPSASRGGPPGRAARVGWLGCAALAGAAGLGLETLLLSAAGLSVGYGRSTALGLAAWIAAWSIGAFVGGRSRGPTARALLVAGAASAVAAVVATEALFFAGARVPGGALAGVLGLAAVALAALPQGALLPLLARGLSAGRGGGRDVGPLFAANLAGAVAGAHWIGFDAAGAWGRAPASWLAAALALSAGIIAARLARGSGADEARIPATHGRLGRGRAALLIGFGTAWALGLEWIGLRLGVLWLGGMQPALSSVLAASLVALAIGAALVPRIVPRDERGVAAVLALAVLASAWPFLAPELLVEHHRQLSPGWLAVLLVGPPLVPFGALVPVVHRCLAGESGRRLGGLLVHEAWGVAIGAPVVHWLLVPSLGLGGAIAVLAGVGGALGLVLLRAARRGALVAIVLGAVLATVGPRLAQPALRSPQLARPEWTRLAFQEDADFAIAVVDDGLRGERTLLTDDFRATAIGEDYLYMRALGHLPVLLHRAPRRVCVLAFGTGTTAGAVSLHPEVERIDVLELSRAVCEQAPFFEEVNHAVFAEGLPGLLDAEDGAGRVVLELGDGRRGLAERTRTYDVITMEPLLPDSPFAVYLYTAEFYGRARAALANEGLLCQWVPLHALDPAVFDAVVDAFVRAFEWSALFLYDTQLILVGGETAPDLDAARWPSEPGALRAALAGLGLDDPTGVTARFVAGGERWPAVERALTDRDPWILYRRRPPGAGVLAYLPHNLARLRGVRAIEPEAWLAAVPAATERRRAAGELHRAQEARARRLAGLDPDPELPSLEDGLRALSALGTDAEARAFERRVRSEAALLAARVALQLGDAASAFRQSIEAASIHPDRATPHLFVAVAAERLGEGPVAERALARALGLCPKLLETRPGRAALDLGLSPGLVERARVAAASSDG